MDNVFNDLKQIVTNNGLFDRTPIRGTLEIGVTVTGVVVMAVYSFFIGVHSIIEVFIYAAVMAVLLSRSIYIIHDILHSQYYKSKKISLRISKMFMVVIGTSISWWMSNHHLRHHPYVNVIGKDADADIMYGIFKNEPVDISPIKYRFRYIIFWVGMLYVYFYFIVESYLFLFRHNRKEELLLMLSHIAVMIAPIIYSSGIYGVSAIVIAYLLVSVWMGLVFSMNHLGRDMISIEEFNISTRMTHQLRTTRSLYYTKFIQWFYGGLNAHIEHHLFPTVSRFNIHKVQNIVREFCNKNGIAYHEVSMLEAYKEIMESLGKSTLKDKK